jgi:hypothetical protein
MLLYFTNGGNSLKPAHDQARYLQLLAAEWLAVLRFKNLVRL